MSERVTHRERQGVHHEPVRRSLMHAFLHTMATAVGCVLAGFLLAVLMTGWAVRRWLGRLDLRRELRLLV